MNYYELPMEIRMNIVDMYLNSFKKKENEL